MAEKKSWALYDAFKAELEKSDASGLEAIEAIGFEAGSFPEGSLSPLMLAARLGRLDCMKSLIARGADVDARDESGMTALMHAAGQGQFAAMEQLLGAQASAAWRDLDGRFLDDVLEQSGHKPGWEARFPVGEWLDQSGEVCKALARRPDVLAELRASHAKYLKEIAAGAPEEQAAKARDARDKMKAPEAARLLETIVEGSSPNDIWGNMPYVDQKKKTGMSVICAALQRGDKELFEALMATGKANPNWSRGSGAFSGYSPLSAACSWSKWAIEPLIRAGANPNARVPEFDQSSPWKAVALMEPSEWRQTESEKFASNATMKSLAKKHGWAKIRSASPKEFSSLAKLYASRYGVQGLLTSSRAKELRAMDSLLGPYGGVFKGAARPTEQFAGEFEKLAEASGLARAYENMAKAESAIEKMAMSVADNVLRLEREKSGWVLRLPQWAGSLAVEPSGAAVFKTDPRKAARMIDEYNSAYVSGPGGDPRSVLGRESIDARGWQVLNLIRNQNARPNTAELDPMLEAGILGTVAGALSGEVPGRVAEISARAVDAFACPARGLPDEMGLEPAVAEEGLGKSEEGLGRRRQAMAGNASFWMAQSARVLGSMAGQQAREMASARLACVEAVGKRASAIMKDRAREFSESKEAARMARGLAVAGKVWGSEVSSAMLGKVCEALEACEAVVEGRAALGVFALRAADRMGLQWGEDVVGRVKGKFRQLGLGEAGWRALSGASESLLGKIFGTVDLYDAYGQPVAAGWTGADEQRLGLFFKLVNAAASFGLGDSTMVQLADLVNADKGEGGYGRQYENASLRELGALVAEEPPERRISSVAEAMAYVQEAAERKERLPSVVKGFLSRLGKVGSEAALQELHLVVDCLSKIDIGVWGLMEKKPSWGQLMAIQAEWHDQMLDAKASPLSWEPLLPEVEGEDGLSACELVDGKALAKEGREMHHCVAGYSKQCHEGKSKIFGVRRDGKRLGTLELQRRAPERVRVEVAQEAGLNAYGIAAKPEVGAWSVVQFRGLCNAKIEDKQAWDFAAKVARACNEREALSKRQALEGKKAREEAAGSVSDKLASKRVQAVSAQPGGAPRA